MHTAPADRSLQVEGRHAHVADGSTFAPGLRLLPAHVRKSVESLYRVLRNLDDLVDEDDPRASERVQAVEHWARNQQADTPETRALSELERRQPFPRESLLQFCAGMRHDIARESIDSEEDFERYCQQAGGSVGIVLANLLGTAGDGDGAMPHEAVKRKTEIGMATLGRAMQVTNILRDIDEDLARGRVYIPRTLIERFGFPAPGKREELLREQIACADALYEQGARAIPLLRDGGAAMALSAALYREILRQIERDGFGRRPGRTIVPAWRTHLLVARYRTADVLEGLRR
ncbi:MAG: squalene/phytoene synthase family protein [Gemmatimonadaceae bacterium]